MTADVPSSSAPIPGARFDHVAVAGPHLPDMLRLYRDLLGGVFLYGGVNHVLGFRAVTLAMHSSKLELIDPLPGSTFLDSFFTRVGAAGGLHHITFEVDDLPAAAAVAERTGYTLEGLRTASPTWDEVFLHPRTTGGVLIQLVHPGTERDAALDYDPSLMDADPLTLIHRQRRG